MVFKNQSKKTVMIKYAKNVSLCCIAIGITLTSCGGAKASGETETTTPPTEIVATDVHYTAADLVDLDLSSYGFPVMTKAPKDAKIIKATSGTEVYVLAGKFFKLTFSDMDGAVADNMDMVKSMVTDKEMNPSFDKLELDEAMSFLKKNKEGKLSFRVFGDLGAKTLIITEGIPFDLSPDGFTDYAADDMKLMYEAAKATVVKP